MLATLADGSQLEYLPDVIGEGSEGVVHFTADRKSIIKFYKSDDDLRDPERQERIRHIVEKYNPTLDPRSGDYWKQLYCWPDGLVLAPRLGVRAPAYPANFYMHNGKEKKLGWFLHPRSRQVLDLDERGDWRGHLQMAITMARSTRRLHSGGLAHSDLSYNNFLGDPVKGLAVMIDLDGLVVPGLHPPRVSGTPGLIAPEVLMGLARPSIRTDLHALAVLIYQVMLFRHPLRGPKVNSTVSAEEDERLSMGEKALFVEHPLHTANRPPGLMTGYQCLGPHLAQLITKSFIHALHTPDQRPTAAEWENALVKTSNLLHPCTNSACPMKWLILSKAMNYCCPFCGEKPTVPYIPVLHFYREQPGKPGNFFREKQRLAVWHGLYIYQWHVFDHVWPGEHADKARQGYFLQHNQDWYLHNLNMDLTAIENGICYRIPRGKQVKLSEHLQLKLSSEPHGRLMVTQFLKI